MNKKQVLEKVKIFVLQWVPSDDIHGYGHTERVFQMCIKIGQELGANLYVLKLAALLHDVGRYHYIINSKNTNHAEISAEITLNFLQTLNFRFNIEDLENIIHCIKAHSFSNKIPPKTLEAKILSDVDKLDALGAIGLYRTIGYTIKLNGNIEDVLTHLKRKIFKLKDQLFLNISKELAQKRYEIINQFYNEIKNEFKLERS
jgi:uncharacterized protein